MNKFVLLVICLTLIAITAYLVFQNKIQAVMRARRMSKARARRVAAAAPASSSTAGVGAAATPPPSVSAPASNWSSLAIGTVMVLGVITLLFVISTLSPYARTKVSTSESEEVRCTDATRPGDIWVYAEKDKWTKVYEFPPLRQYEFCPIGPSYYYKVRTPYNEYVISSDRQDKLGAVPSAQFMSLSDEPARIRVRIY